MYTAFCVFMLLGYVTAGWFYLDDGLGIRPSDTTAYYLGDAPTGGDGDGVALAVPPGEPLRFEKSPRQVMETFHFHLFTVPVVLLIVAHLFMMCGFSTRLKVWVIVLTFTVTFLHVVVPPLVRFVSPGFSVFMFPSAVLMGITWVGITVWPVVEMWRPSNNGSNKS